jgi:hypothetical protein
VFPAPRETLFNLLSDFEDMWQAEQDAEGMNHDIDLTRETGQSGEEVRDKRVKR